ncbi:MAG TPA: hypothetical protein VK191_00370 [Symbiobacteriaceae bacterium]|nr:hypothetical protein [Symbiobacteriaceae bacterium]
MVRATAGWVSVQESGQPLVGLTVLVASVGGEGVQVLGLGETGPQGHFRLEWPRLPGPVDLAILLASSDGRLLGRSHHRGVSGAELQVQLTVPANLL